MLKSKRVKTLAYKGTAATREGSKHGFLRRDFKGMCALVGVSALGGAGAQGRFGAPPLSSRGPRGPQVAQEPRRGGSCVKAAVHPAHGVRGHGCEALPPGCV